MFWGRPRTLVLMHSYFRVICILVRKGDRAENDENFHTGFRWRKSGNRVVELGKVTQRNRFMYAGVKIRVGVVSGSNQVSRKQGEV